MATNVSYLPEKNTEEAKELIALYETCPNEHLEELTKRFGYATKYVFQDAMRKRLKAHRKPIKPNVNLTMPELAQETPIKYIPYPEIKLSPFKIPKLKRDEEDLGIVLADLHLGKITRSYNLEIAKTRLDYLLDSTMTIINLHRPIRKISIFMVGDVVQGENAYQGSKIGETSKGVYEQIHEDAVPLVTKFCLSLAQGVGEVDVYGVRGNHGRYAREAPDKTNWDRFFYKSLADATINQKKVNVYPASEFYQLINIRGFRFFIIHGDQARGNASMPVIAMRRKMQEWYALFGGFNYAYAGHFHSEYFDHINTEADYTICPPLVTGDEWAIEMIGRASQPKQICFGVHDKYGRTFTYHLHTDEAFLPRRFDEPEGEIKL